jgi:hypothetical protein
MPLWLVVFAGWLAACAVATSPQSTRRTPEHPRPADEPIEGKPAVHHVAQVAGDHQGEGLRIIFRKVGVDEFGSLVRRLGPEDRWVVEDAPATVQRDMLERATVVIACDRLPPDGVYYLDLCPLSVPPDACGTRVTATAAAVVEIERASERPIRMRSGAAPIQVSLSPDPAHPKCTFDP